ncbi:pilin [Actinomadura darangshiensis]|uniref:pilin n=1 Tax=Actinomadura darangshiensis TaxID=705336 RepID=UPI001FB82BB7|nr:pilin [Actinomadura darangshiensis]
MAIIVIAAAGAAEAQVLADPPKDLNEVINNITRWLVGLLVSLATLFLTVGGIRYLLAGGDPGEVGKAKDTLKYAAIGYGVAILAPVLVAILKGFVGG